MNVETRPADGVTSRDPATPVELWPQSAEQFERLVDVHLAPLLAYAARRLRDVHEAEDVVQEVFTRVYSQCHKRREVQQVSAYLYRMTANACNDLLRKRAGRAPRLTLFRAEASKFEPSAQNGPRERTEACEQAERVEGLLEQLPPEQAEAVRLRVFAGLTLGQIAAIAQCSSHTVASRLRYAFARLRKIVGKEIDQ